MAEDKKAIPKPTIKTAPPVRPPVSALDQAEPDQSSPSKLAPAAEPKSEPEPVEEISASASDGVETDLVKRLLGLLIDGIAASFIGYLVLLITGSGFLQYAVIGLVMLTRDSLPFLDGQSIGKKAMRIRAVSEEGASLSGDWVTGATRNLLFAVPLLGVIECFIMLSRSGNVGAGRRLGDDWAKTKVIAEE